VPQGGNSHARDARRIPLAQWSVGKQTAAGVRNTTIYWVARRFRGHGEWALWDAREDKGETKLDKHYLEVLHRVVRGKPPDYDWRRPTWTRSA
jgi:hypothetical protein